MMVNLPCLWGSLSQLPSSHLFIHRVPAKLSNRVYALRRVFLPATALVFVNLDGSDTASLWWTDDQWTHPSSLLPVSLCGYQDSSSAVYGLLSRTLSDSCLTCHKSDRVLEYCLFLLIPCPHQPAICSCASWYIMSDLIFSGSYFTPVLRSL